MRTNSVLTPCKVRYFHVTPIPNNKLQRLLRSLVSGGSLRLAPTTPNSSLKLRTNTANLAQSRCGSLVFPFRSPTFPFRFGTFSATRGRRSRDPRPQVTRPAPAGRVTRARGSLAFSEVETGIAAIKTRTAVPFFAGVSHCEEMYRTLFARCEYNDDGTSAVSTNTIFSHEHEDNCSPKIAPLGNTSELICIFAE